jgi:hypothetical protein
VANKGHDRHQIPVLVIDGSTQSFCWLMTQPNHFEILSMKRKAEFRRRISWT